MLLKGTELQKPGRIWWEWLYYFIEVPFEKARVWHTAASLCKNENGICTPAELQAVAKFLFIQLLQKNDAGKGCSTRNKGEEGLDYSAIVMMSAHEALRI